MKKRILSFLCAAAMIISAAVVPVSESGAVFAPAIFASADSGMCGDNVYWEFDDVSGTLIISGTGEMYNYPAWYTTSEIKNVVIENGVTSICDCAFLECEKLTSIAIPDSVSSIGAWTFYGCTSLTSITIPDSVTSIGDQAFCGCTNLTSINIPDSVTSIGACGFGSCTNLTSITIPDSVTSIGNGAFGGCTSFTSITIPDSVTSIGDYAFCGCTNLTSINIPDSVTSIDERVFKDCTSLKSITIPDSVTSIGGSAFSGCTSLSSVAFGNGVTSIGYEAFRSCTSLTSITIPDSVTSIEYSAFENCTSLTRITIPDSVTSIGLDCGDYAFSGCISLTSIDVDNGNAKYSSYDGVLYNKDKTKLFYSPKGKTSVIIPDSVISIVFDSFKDCTSLTSITIPNSISSIDYNAFEYCSVLKDVYYNGTEIEWWNLVANGVKKGNDCLTNATIHFNQSAPVHTHSYTSKITREATCSQTGVRTYTCSCGDSYIEIIPMASHQFVDKTVAPTYDNQGYTQHTCSVCGYSYKDSYKPKKERTSIAKATVSVAATSVYTGKALTPAVTVKLGSKTLAKNTDYTVAYKSNTNCGKATITITGKGAYTGTKSGSFIIKPAKVTAKKLTSPKKKTIKLTWNKSGGGVSGYEVQIALNKKFTKSAKTYNVKATAASKIIKGLKKGKKYFARVRAYKTVGKTKYYGAWSAVKSK